MEFVEAILDRVNRATKVFQPVTAAELDEDYNKVDKEVIIDADGNVSLNLKNQHVRRNFWKRVEELAEAEKQRKRA